MTTHKFSVMVVVKRNCITSFTIVVALGFTNIVFGNFFSNAWSKAVQQTLFEQEVEDRNAIHKIDNHLARRLIVMPLSETFNPNRANQMHGKVQYGDKCSLPSSIGRLIFEKPYEVPWLFEVVPVKTEPDASIVFEDDESEVDKTQPQPSTQKKNLEKAYISPLDFRSPENYIFMPQWLMNSLGLKTNDLVDVSFVRIKLASLVVLQPMTLDWDELLENHGDPKTLLEHEINKYSSLTTGSTIAIEIGGKEYPLFVKDAKAENGVSMKGVRVQDADIKTDIDRQILDKLTKEKKKQEKLEQERKEKEREEQQKQQQQKQRSAYKVPSTSPR